MSDFVVAALLAVDGAAVADVIFIWDCKCLYKFTAPVNTRLSGRENFFRTVISYFTILVNYARNHACC